MAGRRDYRLKDGTKLSGATTILGHRKETGGLMWWANRLAFDPLGRASHLLNRAMEPQQMTTDLRHEIANFLTVPLESYDHNKARDAAADAGTLTHAMVEKYLRGEKPEDAVNGHPPEMVSKSETAFLAFLEWAEQTNLKVEHQELALVSEKYKFGGTLDAAVLTINGKRAIGDWKTSNGLYVDYLEQVAAYGKLWEENFPDDPITGGYHIMRFSKEEGDFHHHFFQNLDDAWEVFLHLKEVHRIEKNLKKRVK